MPHFRIRLAAAALLLLAGCAASNFFAGSAGSKANVEPGAPSGLRASAFTSSWSGTQHADRTPADAGTPDAQSSERRIQELLTVGERSQSSGDDRAARTAYEQVLRLAPGDPYANYQLAILDDKQGRFVDAELHYFALMKQTPNNPDVLTSLGWSYFLQGRYDDSDRVLREALRYDPNHQVAMYNLGWLYGTRGDYEGALAIFRSAGSEADAQKALAELRNSPAPVPVARGQSTKAPATAVVPSNEIAGGTTFESRGATGAAKPEFLSPQARKFAEDYQRLKAENDRQQQDKRARLAQRNISAPSPWDKNRQSAATGGLRDSGRAIPVQGLVGESAFPPANSAFPGGSAEPVKFNGRNPESSAAFPGAAPSQANRPRLADPATQPVFDQPAGTQGQSRLPIITPAVDSALPRAGNPPSWNSLPPDDSSRGNSNGVSVSPPAVQIPEWPRTVSGNDPGSLDPSMRISAGPSPVSGQFNPATQRGQISRQAAQTTAAQLGLSAGSGGLGFPASEWPGSAGGQLTGNVLTPAGAQNLAEGQIPNNSQPAGQPPAMGGQAPGLAPASPPSINAGSRPAPWPARPLSGGSVPQAVVPSAQGVVYGSDGNPGMPAFNPGNPTSPPAR